jgi:2-polyprenyl-3-methyl-5-hydroxy-6-metoxy-1,4-benzoquinol methylase
MPTSKLELAPLLLNLVWQVRGNVRSPMRILDVGPGWGKYGVLLHEYVDPDAEIGCVEAEQRYNDHESMGNTYNGPIWECDVLLLDDDELARFDVVMMIDVIEHIEKAEALALLDRLPGYVIICTPEAWFQNPEADQGYETERHRSHWTVDDFQRTGRCDYIDVVLGGICCRLRPIG